jgi:lipopolysaccharide/colanic/teichoic acid biosynthesis glycosyltransferase
MFRCEKTPVWKRAIDIVGAGVGILVLSPLFIGAAIAIKLSAPGPVFFRQMREGKDGKPFGILKFRTMVIDAEAKQEELREQSEQDGPAFKLKDDPRVTKVGKYLRKSCIDELPQLFNVLVGQMSLVGPRPLPIGESEQCRAWQRQRLSVLPGCTCIWQARGGRDIKFSKWMRMDLEYIHKRSFLYDLRLILETVYIAVLHRGSV